MRKFGFYWVEIPWTGKKVIAEVSHITVWPNKRRYVRAFLKGRPYHLRELKFLHKEPLCPPTS